MNKVVTALLLLCFATPLIGTAQQGTVKYEETIKLKIELPPEMADMKDKIPSSQSGMKVLLFNEVASLMKPAPPEETKENKAVTTGGGMVFKIGMDGAENELYSNFEDETAIEKRDFMGRTFLIDGGEDPIPWKLTNERSEFLGYMCLRATAVVDSTEIEAWFTPEVPVPAGPDKYTGLPGLILVLNIDGGDRTYVAKELVLDELPEGAIAAPKKGKKVTRTEFDEIVAEKMKEMGAQRSGGNSFQVTIRH